MEIERINKELLYIESKINQIYYLEKTLSTQEINIIMESIIIIKKEINKNKTKSNENQQKS